MKINASVNPRQYDMEIPYSADVEVQILGAIMRENSILENLNLHEKYFYSNLHGKIFSACKTKIENGHLATPVSLEPIFRNEKDLPGQGKYLAMCVATCNLSLLQARQAANYVKELYDRRNLIRKCEEAKYDLMAGDKDVISVATNLAKECEDTCVDDKRFIMRDGTEVAQAIIDGMKKKVNCYSTGINRLDKAMDGGLWPGKLYGFAGKKKHGKTILAGTMSVNLALNGVKHLFICGEMSAEEVHQRNLARMGGFYPTAFQGNKEYTRSEDFKVRFVEAMQWQQNNIIFINAPALTFEKLKQIIKQAVLKYGIKGFILDYWQLVGGKEPKKSTAEHLDEVAQWLADCTKQYNIFGISMAQINQEGNTRGSEGLRLACDQMYNLQRAELNQPGMWLEMMDTRYTAWFNIGSADNQVLTLNPKGVWFEEGN